MPDQVRRHYDEMLRHSHFEDYQHAQSQTPPSADRSAVLGESSRLCFPYSGSKECQTGACSESDSSQAI
jgi:hypothetical protein